MRRETSKMAVAVGSFNPNVARLEGEAKGLESKLIAEAQTRLENLRMTAQASSREVASLQATMLKMRAGYDRLEANSVQLSALEQAVIAARTVYQNFQTRWQMTEQSGFNEAKGWLVSPAAVPVRPSSRPFEGALEGASRQPDLAQQRGCRAAAAGHKRAWDAARGQVELSFGA
jgi:uncharacterized protein involved in exopolysaccharide biosynthesis